MGQRESSTGAANPRGRRPDNGPPMVPGLPCLMPVVPAALPKRDTRFVRCIGSVLPCVAQVKGWWPQVPAIHQVPQKVR